MGLTEKLARVVSTVESDETYECTDCGERFPLDRQTCPDCGGCNIDRIDWESIVTE